MHWIAPMTKTPDTRKSSNQKDSVVLVTIESDVAYQIASMA